MSNKNDFVVMLGIAVGLAILTGVITGLVMQSVIIGFGVAFVTAVGVFTILVAGIVGAELVSKSGWGKGGR